MRRHHVTVAAFALVVAVLLSFPAVSPAPVAPVNCGNITVDGKKMQIKADQIRCTDRQELGAQVLDSRWSRAATSAGTAARPRG